MSGQKKVTLNDLQEITGVSKSTISRVVNNSKYVNPDVRTIVQKAIKETGYKKSTHHLKINLHLTKITLVIGDYLGASSGFYTSLISEIRQQAIALQIEIDLIVIKEGQQDLLKQIKEKQGILLLGLDEPKLLDAIVESEIPAVIVNGSDLRMRISSISPDYELGGLLASNTLLNNGHKKLLYIGSNYRHSLYQRKSAFLRAVEQSGSETVEHSKLLILENYAKEEMNDPKLAQNIIDGHTGMDFAAHLILPHAIKNGLLDNITGVFCICDMVAVSLIDALSQMGKKVPEDYSIIGFDDLEISSMTTPPLTTIKTDFKELARSAVHLLLSSSSKAKNVTSRQLSNVYLVERKSIKKY